MSPEIVSDQIVVAASILVGAVGLLVAWALFGAWRSRSRERVHREAGDLSISLRAVINGQSVTAAPPERPARLDQRPSDAELVRFF